MSKVLCYHGTALSNVPSILEKGLICTSEKLWYPSENAIYCYSKNFVKETGCSDEYGFLRECADAGAVAAIKSHTNCGIAVIKFEVEESELETDYSCPFMEMANCIYRNILPEEILEVFVSDDLTQYRLLMSSMIIQNQNYINIFTPIEENIIKGLNSSLFFDNIDEIVNLKPLGKKV